MTYKFDGSNVECMLQISIDGEEEDEDDIDSHVAVKAGRTIIISDGLDGDEDEIMIITINPI